MKTLILMRHANAELPRPGQRDRERMLNQRGRDAGALMGEWLRDQGHVPEAALVSSAMRTQETWRGLGFTCEAFFQDALYLAEPDEILSAVNAAPDCACLLVLGHNPGMAAAMGMTPKVQRRISAPDCATGVYRLAIQSWRDATFGAAEMLAFETPKSLV